MAKGFQHFASLPQHRLNRLRIPRRERIDQAQAVDRAASRISSVSNAFAPASTATTHTTQPYNYSGDRAPSRTPN
jgi:hypothetical protein